MRATAAEAGALHASSGEHYVANAAATTPDAWVRSLDAMHAAIDLERTRHEAKFE